MKVVVVDVGEDATKVLDYAAKNPVGATVALDGNSEVAKRLYGTAWLPHLLVLGRDLEVLFTKGGLQQEPLFEAVERAIGRPPRRWF